jgi:hypothetical protein
MQSEDEDLEIPDEPDEPDEPEEPDEPDEPESGQIQPNKDAVSESRRLLASRKQIDARIKELGSIAAETKHVSLPRHHCVRCGHNWIGRNPDNAPAQCPRCGVCLWWKMPVRAGAKVEGSGGPNGWRNRRRSKGNKVVPTPEQRSQERVRLKQGQKPVPTIIPRPPVAGKPIVPTPQPWTSLRARRGPLVGRPPEPEPAEE